MNDHDLQKRNHALIIHQLRELVGIAAAALGGQIADEDQDLVGEELERLEVRRTFGTLPANADGNGRNMLHPSRKQSRGD